MPPTVRAALIAVVMACTALTAQSGDAMAARATPGASLVVVVATVGPTRAPEPPALAARPAPDAASLPAKLALSALSLSGLAMHLRRRAR